MDYAKGVEVSAPTPHAAGVVFQRPSHHHVPLQRVSRESKAGLVMTQYPMDDIASIGLLKMDFLGLSNLTTLGRTQQIIRQNRGIDIDRHDIPMDDKKTFELLDAGETVGVFQLEGSGMRRYIKELKPTVFSDIAAMLALCGGPMEQCKVHPLQVASSRLHIPTPLKGGGPTASSFIRSRCSSSCAFAATAGAADIFRKAMGKKKPR